MTLSRLACILATTVLVTLPSGCATTAKPTPDAEATQPAMRWDHRPEAEFWTETTIASLQAHGGTLLSTTPKDIAVYCPGYAEGDTEQRAEFWTGLFSAIAKYESTWNPRAVGGGGKYKGLLQILPQTAKGVGCDAGQLLDGASNLSCAVKIANRRVPGPTASVAAITADWGPMHHSDKRAEMAAWTRQQSYCQAG